MIVRGQAVVAVLLAGMAIGMGAGWSIHSWRTDAALLKAEQRARDAEQKEVQRANEIAGLWAANAEALRAASRRRESALRRELEDERYRCALPDSGGLLLNAAVDAANAAREPSAAVPAAAEVRGPDTGGVAAP